MSNTMKAISSEYTINMDYSQLNFLTFILEVSMNRQLNFIAYNNKKIDEIDEKIAEVEKDIKNGKKGFFSNPKSKLDELTNKRLEIVKAMYEPKRDLSLAREIYNKVFDERENVVSGERKYINKKYFEDREHMHLYGPYKDYFKIEHYIY